MNSGTIHSRETKHNKVVVRKVRDRIEMEVAGGSFGTWHPRCKLTGYYWDTLGAACLLHNGPGPKSILMLGLGGGTAIGIINKLLPDSEIIAVELDEELIDVAEEYLHLDKSHCSDIVIGDAYQYLRTSEQSFDIVIDDLFLTGADDVYRSDVNAAEVLSLIKKRLKPNGTVICNLITHTAHRRIQIQSRKAYTQSFDDFRILRPKEGANEVIVGGTDLNNRKILQSKLDDFSHPSDRKWWKSITVRLY